MKKQKQSNRHIRDIIEVEDHTFDIDNIERVARDDAIRREYEKKYRGRFYASILASLTHESFSEEEARALWEEIMAHMGRLNRTLKRNIGVAVAAMDYLSNIRDRLKEPKIIEENKSSFVTEATTRDEMTGLYLREVFETVLKKEVAETNRSDRPFCLLMLDIDDFKAVNDRYGHVTGDDVLRAIGRTINSRVREMDLAARYGGEEMAVIMPDTEIARAREIAERIRGGVQALSFDGFTVTVSIGVCQYTPHQFSPEGMIESADEALYRAKKNGKNQVRQCREP